MQLEQRVALVTGSTSGIGAAIAQRFAREGARVVVHGVQKEETERTAQAIRDNGGNTIAYLADLRDPSECRALIEATVAHFGTIDILVNNAAVLTRASLENMEVETFDEIIAVNTRAPLLLIQAALPHFRRAGGGAVLNIGSVNAYCGEPNLLPYSISKGGLLTLSRNLADAYCRENIRINHLNVGWVLSQNENALKIREGLPEDWAEHLPRSVVPSGRLLSPDEIAHYALSFVSEGGGPVSGAVVELEQFPIIGRNPPKGTDD